MTWVRVDTNLRHHPKTKRLDRTLGEQNTHVYVVNLWAWAAEFSRDGDLSRLDDLDLAIACGWHGEPQRLREALLSAGFLERDGDRTVIHDWQDHAGKLIEKEERDRSRKRTWDRSVRGRSDVGTMSESSRTDNGEASVRPSDLGTLVVPSRIVSSREVGEGECEGEGRSTGFDRFWAAYPRKVGKLAARKAWEQMAGERPPLNALLSKLAQCGASQQWREQGGRYVPHPATWLRRGGWDDEIPVATGPRSFAAPGALDVGRTSPDHRRKAKVG